MSHNISPVDGRMSALTKQYPFKLFADVRAAASFAADKEYRVHVKLRVGEVGESEDPDDMDCEEVEVGVETSSGSTKNLVALDVVIALCECPAGLSGGCSHTTMLLFLARLLTLNDRELSAFNPSTCTSRACAWIVSNSKRGRSTTKCPLYGKPLSEGTADIRKLRDLRAVGMEEDTPVQTRGVTGMDRMNDFNPHPTGGVFTELERQFTAGKDYHIRKFNKLMAFTDCERVTEDNDLGVDVLLPNVREP